MNGPESPRTAVNPETRDGVPRLVDQQPAAPTTVGWTTKKRPAQTQQGTPSAGRRRDVIDKVTRREHVRQWRRWEASCGNTGQDPLNPTPVAIRNHLAELAGAQVHPAVAPGTLTRALDAIKRRHWEKGVGPDGLYGPAERFLAAAHDARPGPVRPPTPPMLRKTVAELADRPGTTGQAHPAQIARGRAALLALHAGNPPELLWRATLPTDQQLGRPGALVLDSPGHRPPPNTLELTDTARVHGLPSPAQAARDLARHVPSGTTRLLGICTSGHGHDEPARPLRRQSDTRDTVLGQLETAARRAGLPWTREADTTQLTEDEVRLLDRALNPDHVTAPRDHAIRTTGHATAMRGKGLRKIQITDAHRTDTEWHITVPSSKTKRVDGYVHVVEPNTDPKVCPVRALDAHVANLTAHGYQQWTAGSFSDFSPQVGLRGMRENRSVYA